MKHTDEVVDVVGPVATRVQSFGQGEERLGVIGEEVYVENGLRVRDVVLLQVCVKARSWGSRGQRTSITVLPFQSTDFKGRKVGKTSGL